MSPGTSGAWGKAAPAVPRPLVSMVAIAAIFIAFPGFLIGRYAAGLAQSEGFGLLRAAGGYVLGNVIGLILIAIALSHLLDQAALLETLRRALESVLAARSARARRGFSTVIPGPGVSFKVSGASALRCQPFLVAMATLALAFSPWVALTGLGLTS